jgi:hypothetical protein
MLHSSLASQFDAELHRFAACFGDNIHFFPIPEGTHLANFFHQLLQPANNLIISYNRAPREAFWMCNRLWSIFCSPHFDKTTILFRSRENKQQHTIRITMFPPTNRTCITYSADCSDYKRMQDWLHSVRKEPLKKKLKKKLRFYMYEKSFYRLMMEIMPQYVNSFRECPLPLFCTSTIFYDFIGDESYVDTLKHM